MEKENTGTVNLEYVKKRVLAAIRKDFEEEQDGVFPQTDVTKLQSRTADAVYSALVEMWLLPGVATEENVPFIDENTSDDFEITLSPLALEALICLAASKLCTEESANTYTRLLYKYKDLTEGLYGVGTDAKSRNGFYCAKGKRGVV